MPINLRIVLICITVIYLLIVLKKIKDKKLQLSFSTFWIVSTFLLMIAVITPNLIEQLTKSLGFEIPANMLFCITIFIAFYLIFSLTIRLSKEAKKNVILVQELSILKKRVEKLEEKENEGK